MLSLSSSRASCPCLFISRRRNTGPNLLCTPCATDHSLSGYPRDRRNERARCPLRAILPLWGIRIADTSPRPPRRRGLATAPSTRPPRRRLAVPCSSGWATVTHGPATDVRPRATRSMRPSRPKRPAKERQDVTATLRDAVHHGRTDQARAPPQPRTEDGTQLRRAG